MPLPRLSTALLVVAAVALLPTTARAGCRTDDDWTGSDKTRHFLVGTAVGAGGTLLFDDPDRAFLAGAALALAKEAVDARSRHGTCSFQDFAVTIGGAAAGAYGTAWIVGPNFVGFARRF